MNTKHLSTGIACGVFALALAAAVSAQAQSPEDSIQFPVAELGNCGSKEECKAYCDEPGNIEACLSFAEKNNLMPPEEIEMAKKFVAAGASGPGGCTGKESCEAYCNDINNIDACVSFAEENGMMSGDELAEAKKVQAAIRSGVKPPPCGGKQACDAYCESPENMPACLEFAKAAGLMSPEEQADAQMMLRAIQSGAKPPACRGKEECDAYCSDEAHFSECLEFGKAAGFMSDEEYEMAKKTGGRGPGGCRGKEACDAFCTSSPENEEVCLTFQVEKGLMSEEQRSQMEGGKQKMRESFSNMPEEVAQCIRERIGSDTFEKLKSGEQRVTRTIGEAMPACFQQFEGQRQAQENERRPQEGGPPPEGVMRGPGPESMQRGPSPEEMEAYRRQMTEQGGYGGQQGPPPEGSYPPPCEGENCRPPEGFAPPEGQQYGSPPPEGQREYAPPAPSETSQGTAPKPASAPATEPALAPEPVVSTESLSAAAILFLRAFGF